jgi:glycosyltransferase involved in cell wall biosynthesis
LPVPDAIIDAACNNEKKERPQVCSSVLGANITSKVLAVVPVYNGQQFAIRAIKSLLSQNYPNLRIVVIDDRSEDDSTSLISKEFSRFPQITMLRNEKNIGFAQTLNRVLELVTDEEFLLVLEQDCELLSNDYIMEAFKQLHYNDNVAVVSGEDWLPEGKELSLMKKIFVHHLCEDVYDTGIVETGFSLLKADVLRVEVLRKVGGFESSSEWKLAGEEHIISHKIRLLGYKIIKDSNLKFTSHWDGQEKLRQNLRKEAIYGRGLGWALARTKSDLEVGESKQLRSKRLNRVIQLQYVLLTVLSALLFGARALFSYNLLVPLTLLSLATLIQLGYLCYRASVLSCAKERLLFIVTGFLRAWVYISNFFFGFFCGFMLDIKEKITGFSKAS